MSNTDLTATQRSRAETSNPDGARTPSATTLRAAAPAVDIFEDAGGITVLADMPGVSRDHLEVNLDGDSLVIEGSVNIATPEGMRALWAEVNVPHYRRSFTLSRELDATRIGSNLKDGLLKLRIPKQAHAQPRRIAVQPG